MLILNHLKSLDAESVESNTVWKRVEERVLSAVRMSENDSNKFGPASKEKLTREQNVTTAPQLGTPPPSPLTVTETKPPSKDFFSPAGAPPRVPPPPPPPQIKKPKGIHSSSELILISSNGGIAFPNETV